MNELRKKQNKRARRLPSSSLKLEFKGISGGGAVDPERITRGVISLTTGDSRRGSMGSIFRFLGLCVCLGVQRGLSRVLIKYSGNVRLQKNKYERLALVLGDISGCLFSNACSTVQRAGLCLYS